MKIIKFTALWCADCIVMRPMWTEIKERFPSLEIIEYDFDEHTEVVLSYGVKKVPHTVIIDDDGKELAKLEGLKNKEDLISAIEEFKN